MVLGSAGDPVQDAGPQGSTGATTKGLDPPVEDLRSGATKDPLHHGLERCSVELQVELLLSITQHCRHR